MTLLKREQEEIKLEVFMHLRFHEIFLKGFGQLQCATYKAQNAGKVGGVADVIEKSIRWNFHLHTDEACSVQSGTFQLSAPSLDGGGV